jgi:hypothetical protein
VTGVAGLPRPIGCVLGGGVSLGAIQVGMLQALSELDMVPDLVAGTSVGSLNGAALALDPTSCANRLACVGAITAPSLPRRAARSGATAAAHQDSPVPDHGSRRPDRAAELYRMWSSNLLRHPTRPPVADEHKTIFDAALARDSELAVDLMTQYLRPWRVPRGSRPLRRPDGRRGGWLMSR